MNMSINNIGSVGINKTEVLRKYVENALVTVSYTKPLLFLSLSVIMEIIEIFLIRHIAKHGPKDIINNKLNDNFHIQISTGDILINIKVLKIVFIILAIIFMTMNKALITV